MDWLAGTPLVHPENEGTPLLETALGENDADAEPPRVARQFCSGERAGRLARPSRLGEAPAPGEPVFGPASSDKGRWTRCISDWVNLDGGQPTAAAELEGDPPAGDDGSRAPPAPPASSEESPQQSSWRTDPPSAGAPTTWPCPQQPFLQTSQPEAVVLTTRTCPPPAPLPCPPSAPAAPTTHICPEAKRSPPPPPGASLCTTVPFRP
eukprot:CAMPEP_0204304748 /NCGR_PEP_ID=MMETSP0468-20130131/84574_1 /ASSEMBLY_ACC=CAM_ASM_000383 /TAXON_ID=2969 /ORGANISM="Oxyrrhis marina" /LENGTH=207 /DNA_ID=CAMNT_0051284079 /DNA_START=956 /DNA_END=1580 /DNA_ORIENTATION=-